MSGNYQRFILATRYEKDSCLILDQNMLTGIYLENISPVHWLMDCLLFYAVSEFNISGQP